MTESVISYKIRGAIYAVYNTLGPGLLESVYQEALVYQLRKDGLEVKEQAPVPIIYDGHKLSADLHTNSVRYAVSDSGDMRSLVFQVFLRLQS